MALTASQQWWLRTGGDELNGGGYDATVSGAGTNYANQDAAQLSLSDMACANSTTLTSVTGGFTALMIGNIVRIASGTNFTAGYYMVTARASTNSVTVDRNPTNGGSATGGTGRLGGAFASPVNLASGGTANQPVVASPLAPGHIVNVRGGGTDNPASPDYTPTGGTGYWTMPAGNLTTGIIQFTGFNGRPFLQSDGAIIKTSYWRLTHVKLSPTGTASPMLQDTNAGGSGKLAGLALIDVVFDQNGQDCALCDTVGMMQQSFCTNTGSTAAGTVSTVKGANHGGWFYNNQFAHQRGPAIELYQMGGAVGNLITDCRLTTKGAIEVGTIGNIANPIVIGVINNTLDSNLGDGIRALDAGGCCSGVVFNNLVTNSGRYNLNYPTNADRFVSIRPDYNAVYNGGTANRNNVSAGAHDVTLSANPYMGSGDYALNGTAGGGAACVGVGLWGTVPGGVGTGAINIGAVA